MGSVVNLGVVFTVFDPVFFPGSLHLYSERHGILETV